MNRTYREDRRLRPSLRENDAVQTLYYEDIEIPTKFTSTGRTVTETDLTMFSMMSGDWHPLHCDAEYAKTTQFGQRIVAGIYGFVLVSGAYTKWGVFDDSGLAMLSIDEWRFHAPILVGDTIHVEMTLVGKRLTSAGDRGVLDRALALVNQNGAVVQSGKSALLVARRPTAADARPS